MPCGGGFGQLILPGRYEVAIDSGEYVVGAARTHPEDCSATDPSDDQFCNLMPVTVAPCGETIVFTALYCDPGRGTCPDVVWPWSAPRP